MSKLSDAARKKLKSVSTATVATALFKRGLRIQMIQDVRPLSENQPTLVGEAFTLRYMPAREDLNKIDVFRDRSHPQRKAIEDCPPGAVLVMDSRKDARAASAGAILVTRLMKRGCAGVVTDGGFRDSAEIARLGFPAYHHRPSAPTNLTLHQAIEINVPIGCGDAPVFPGDVILGDSDGVIVIPAHLADEIADETFEMTAFEDFVTEEVQNGRGIFGLYPATDEKTLTDFAAWRKARGDRRAICPTTTSRPSEPASHHTGRTTMSITRRHLLAGAGAATASALLARPAAAQSFPFTPNQRYPDPAVQILDPSFAKYRIYSSTLEQVTTGFRWAEGPAYFPEGGYLLFSDIPNNRIMKFDEKTGQTSVFRSPSNYANGNARDRQGRLVTCEHSVTRRITRTEKDGKVTVLADKFDGKRLNAPNDIVVKSDDSIWFTDPLFGINGEWEGKKEKPEQATTNVYRLSKDGKLTAVITDIVNPNGLAFSPDEKKLYVVEWKGTPNRSIWGYDVKDDGTLGSRTKVIDAADQGALDGFRVDRDGNLWCGWGSNGALQSEPSDVGGRKVFQLKGKSEDLDGVMVFNPEGKPLAHIRLPERCANLCFGGPKNNRVYMTACHSVYALYVEAHGAV